MSNSSLSSFFSASPGTQDSTSFSGDSLSVGGSASSSGSSVSDTVRNSATITPTSSFGSVSEIRLTSSTASNLSNLLSVSLSLDTIGSHQSISSTTPVPPYPIKVSKMRVQTLVDLKSSPFVRRRKFAARFSDEQEQKPVITTPTPARLRSLMKEKLYIGGWINKVDGGHIPEHIPWEFQDAFVPIPWIPEGSLVSKNRFHQVRREQLPRSHSPPPTPPAAPDVLPLDVLPFPAIVSSSIEGPTLKRAASFHPGGSQRLRREASVMNGKVTIDTGFKLRSRSLESIVSSSSVPNNVDLVVRQLDSGHQSGLERLKISMLRLMKAQSTLRRPIATEGERSKLSFPAVGQNRTKVKIAGRASRELLAARRGQRVPSTLKLVPTRNHSPVSTYNSDIPTPFRESSAVGTPLPEADKRESIDVEDMCTNLRYLVSPIILDPARKEGIPLSQSGHPAAVPTDDSVNGVSETPQTPVEEWNFASELEGTYGDDPFSYFDSQERMPSFVRPLSMTPDIVAENTETSGLSVTSVSTFPEPPVSISIPPPVPRITISEDEPALEYSSVETRSSLASSATEDILYSADHDEMPMRTTASSAGSSPRTSEDKDQPLAIRRLTLLARSSVAIPKLEDFPSAGNLPSLAQETLKRATKMVRFASEVEEHTSLGNPVVTCPPCARQRPRSSSVPPPQKSSFRNQTFLQLDVFKHERLSRSQPATLPSRIPQKRTFTRTGQHPVTKDTLAPAESRNRNEGIKRLSSLIPITGLKAPYAPFSLNHEKAGGGKRAIDRSSKVYVSLKQPSRTPPPEFVKPQQKTPLATSWSMTLRQYVKGGDPSSEKRGISRSQSPKRRGELNLPPRPYVGTKSLLPVKKTSFFRDGFNRAIPPSETHDHTESERHGRAVGRSDNLEGNAIGSVDKTGGISYIAPPKVRERSQSQGRVKQGPSPAAAATRTLKPVQIRSLLGRFAA